MAALDALAKVMLKANKANAPSSFAVAPSILRLGSGANRDLAADVLDMASRPKKSRETFAAWREANEGKIGHLFDYSDMGRVPDVRQYDLPRVIPAQGPSSRLLSALNDPEVGRALDKFVERGVGMGGPAWYNTEPFRDRVLGVLGPDRGADRYGRIFGYQAATSPTLRVPDNIRTGSIYDYLAENDLPFPEKFTKGYGAKAQDNHRKNATNLREGRWDVLENPKPLSFSQNLQGNYRPMAVDTHNMRALALASRDPEFIVTSYKEAKGVPTIAPRKMIERGEMTLEEARRNPIFLEGAPRDNEYGAYERWQQQRAREMGLAPAQYQASMWLGAGDVTGLGSPPEPWLKTFDARVNYTADRLGISPERLLEAYIRGETPLLAKGGAVRKPKLR